jgi:hypothetical protein
MKARAFRRADLAAALPQRTNKAIRKLILLERFQIGLPLNRKAIMLRGNWR